MINIYPAFQFMFSVAESGSGDVTKEVYGSEVLARTDLTHDSFSRPDGTSWRSVDLRVVNVLQQNATDLPVKDKRLFINVSQFSLNDDESFFRWLISVARLRHTLGAEARLVVEITEHVEPETLSRRWDQIKECGIMLAIDDYGVGESTLVRLQMFPWDYCKFDLTVLSERELAEGADYCWKAKILGIAEKVETFSQSRVSLNYGLHIQQGFLFCRPFTKKVNYPALKDGACESKPG